MKLPRNLVGPRVRQAREAMQPPLTQQDLSARLEVRGVHLDRAGISKIEQGSRAVSDIELVAFSDALNVSVSWLLGEG